MARIAVLKDASYDQRQHYILHCATILPPPSRFVGEKETREALDDWATKVYDLADALYKKVCGDLL